MIMRHIVWRLIVWVAEYLDRNLITVPDVDVEKSWSRHTRVQFPQDLVARERRGPREPACGTRSRRSQRS